MDYSISPKLRGEFTDTDGVKAFEYRLTNMVTRPPSCYVQVYLPAQAASNVNLVIYQKASPEFSDTLMIHDLNMESDEKFLLKSLEYSSTQGSIYF